MNKRIMLISVIMILLIHSVTSFTQNQFTNGNNQENLSFQNNESIIRYLKLPFHSNVTMANLTIRSVNEKICIQDTANISNSCGGSANGTYFFSVVAGWNPAALQYRAIDDHYTTYAPVNAAGAVFIQINYSIPSSINNLNHTYWRLGVEDQIIGTDFYERYINFSESCLNHSIHSGNISLLWEGHGAAVSNNNRYKCQNGTGWELLTIQSGNPNMIEEGIIWDAYGTPLNPWLITGTSGYEWNHTNLFNDTKGVNISIHNKIKTILNNNCNCTGCSLDSTHCTIPLIFHSDIGAILELSDISIDYTLPPIPLNITFKDSDSGSIIKENLTVQITSTTFNTETTITDGTILFNVTFDTTTDMDLSIIAFQTPPTDYTISIRELTMSQGVGQNITMYLTNTSDVTTTKTVIFNTRDENLVDLEGAIIHIYQRDPSTGEFLLLTDLTTNPNGEASTILILDTVFYRFIVEYQGRTVYVSSAPYPISSGDDIIYLVCIVGEGATTYYGNINNVVADVEFIRTTNETGYFTLNYYSPIEMEICLDTYYFINSVQFNTSYQCENGTQNIFDSSTITVTQLATVYSDVYIDFSDDGEPKLLYSRTTDVLGLDDIGRASPGRLLVFFGIIIFAGVIFIKTPIMGLIVLCVGVLVIAFTNFTMITIGWSMFVVSLAIFIMLTISKNENK